MNDSILPAVARLPDRQKPSGGMRAWSAGCAVLRFAYRPGVFVIGALAVFLGLSVIRIEANSVSAAGRRDFYEGDTGHYLDIARGFAAGDFSMSYVEARPHRQPLYPLLLAPIFRWDEGRLTGLAGVNIAVTALTFLSLYFELRRRLRSRVVATAVAGLFLLNPFVWAQATQHLLTEPLHLLLATGVIFALWDFLAGRRVASLGAAFGFAGLDYLARPNGLFLAAAMATVVALGEARRFLQRGTGKAGCGWRGVGVAMAVAAVFTGVSAPSWVPRICYYGNPVYHGYLSNYLWVDSYAEAHVGQRWAKYSARDYMARHGVGDAVRRLARGTWQCFAVIPVRMEGRMPGLFLLAAAGIGVILWRGRRGARRLLLLAALQMAPLAWTNLSNPTVRVPYGAWLPFELTFAAVGLHAALVLGRSRRRAGRGAGGGAGRHHAGAGDAAAREPDAVKKTMENMENFLNSMPSMISLVKNHGAVSASTQRKP